MPQSLAELGAAFLAEQRQKEEQKNANSLAKMRMESLTRQAQTAEDEQRGARNVVETIDPLVNLWQAQAAQMRRETAEANRRSALTSQLALSALEEQRSRPTTGISGVMSDTFDAYKTMKRMEIIEGLQQGVYPQEWELQFLMPSVEHPASAMRKMMTREAEKETADIRQIRRSVVTQWNNEMDALAKEARTLEGQFPEMADILEMQRQDISRRYIRTLEDMGIEAPDVMYNRAQMVRPLPAMEKPAALKPRKKGGRLPQEKGEPVYEGRKDITYGTEKGYERMAPEQERAALAKAYTGAVKEVFGEIPDDEVTIIVDELMKGWKPPKGKPRVRTMPFQTQHLRAAGPSPVEAWKRGLTEIKRRLKK